MSYYIPEGDEHGPRFLPGSRGGARGCDFEEQGGACARTEGGCFLLPTVNFSHCARLVFLSRAID